MRVAVHRRRSAVACAWLACTLLDAGAAAAQAAPAAETSTPDAATHAQPQAVAGATPATGATEPDADTTPGDAETLAPITPLAAVYAGDNKLQRELTSVRYEQEHSSTLLPWTLTAAGVAVLVVGMVAGARAALSCDHSCRSPWWPGWVVVAGSGMAIAGVLWLRLEDRDLAELQSRRYHLEQELERSRINAAPLPETSPHAALRLRVKF